MKTWQDFDLIQLVILPLFLFSATFYPIETYPEALRVIVQLTPLYQGVDLIRSLTVGAISPILLFHVAYLLVMGFAGLFVVSRRLDKLLLSSGSGSWPTDRAALARADRRDRRLPALPAARRVARARRPREGRPVPRRGVLGPAGPGLRRPGGADPGRRAGAGGARRQPDRARVHRRRLRRLPVARRCIAPGSRTGRRRRRADDGLTLTTCTSRPRSAARRRPTSRRPRSATTARRSWPASWPARARPGDAGARGVRLGRGAAGDGVGLGHGRRREAAVRPRRRGRGRAVRAPRLLPPEPAEHVHRPPDAGDARRRARAGASTVARRPTTASTGRRARPASRRLLARWPPPNATLRGPRRRARRDRRRDQARLPQARPAVAPGREQGPRGAGPVQGGQRGLPDPVRPRTPAALRHVRAGGGRRWAGGPAPGSRGSAGSATSSTRSSAARPAAARRVAAGRSPARTCATTCGSRSRRPSRARRRRSSSACSAAARRARAAGAKPGTEATTCPQCDGPRRGPQRPPDDARPDGQRQRLPALPRRGQDRRDAVRDVQWRRPDRAQAHACA